MSVRYNSANIHGVTSYKIIIIIVGLIFVVSVLICLDRRARGVESRLEVAIMKWPMTSLLL